MRITSSAVAMASKNTFVERHTKEESLKMWTGNQRPNFEGRDPAAPMRALQLDLLELSEEGKKLQAKQASTAATGISEEDEYVTVELSDRDKQKLLAIQKMIEALTGKKIRFHALDGIKLKKPKGECPPSVSGTNPPAPQRQGWGLEYEYHESHYERQTMSFAAEGSVKTEDGREINFSIQLNMSREFFSKTDVSLRAGDAVRVDPLVVNFSGSPSGLTDAKYSFDLDADGTSDQISFTRDGSGFLALDANSDGIINNGLELFGPQSGDGFLELSKFDGDGNGWIDENDPIYEKLRIWTKDENGNDQLFALGQKGIGAIYLGNVSTLFDWKNSQNELQGAISKTGVFLRENGTAGTIQHIDLAI